MAHLQLHSNNNSSGSSSSDPYCDSEERISELESQLNDYKTTLSEANDRIMRVSDCASSAEDAADYGIEAVLDEICTEETVT